MEMLTVTLNASPVILRWHHWDQWGHWAHDPQLVPRKVSLLSEESLRLCHWARTLPQVQGGDSRDNKSGLFASCCLLQGSWTSNHSLECWMENGWTCGRILWLGIKIWILTIRSSIQCNTCFSGVSVLCGFLVAAAAFRSFSRASAVVGSCWEALGWVWHQLCCDWMRRWRVASGRFTTSFPASY